MTVVFVILWIICGLICAGIMIHLDFLDKDDEESVIISPLVGISIWPVLLIIYIGWKLLSMISCLPLFIAGFIDSVHKKEDE